MVCPIVSVYAAYDVALEIRKPKAVIMNDFPADREGSEVEYRGVHLKALPFSGFPMNALSQWHDYSVNQTPVSKFTAKIKRKMTRLDKHDRMTSSEPKRTQLIEQRQTRHIM